MNPRKRIDHIYNSINYTKLREDICYLLQVQAVLLHNFTVSVPPAGSFFFAGTGLAVYSISVAFFLSPFLSFSLQEFTRLIFL